MDKLKLNFFLLVPILLSSQLFSQNTYTWNGSTDNNWAEPSNWTPSGIPGSLGTGVNNNDVVIINALPEVILDQDRSLRSIDISGGMLNLEINKLYLNQDATLTGGTIIGNSITPGELDVRRFISMSGTTFQDIILSRRGTSGTGNNDAVDGGNTFEGNVTITNTGNSSLTLANSTPDDFNGNITFNQSAGALDVATNGNNNFAGNITIMGAPTFNGGVAGTGITVIDGTTPQEITGADITIPRLEMDTNDTLTLNTNVRISDSLGFVNGIISSSQSNKLIIGENAGIHVNNSPDNSSHVDGPVQKNGFGPSGFIFPTGDQGFLGSATISSGSVILDSITVEYIKGNPADDPGIVDLTPGPDLFEISPNEYWRITTMSIESVSLTLEWVSSRSGSIADPSDVVMVMWDSDNNYWIRVSTGTGTGDSNNGSVTASISGSGIFTFGSLTADLLPIELLHFTATTEESGKVRLDWATATEFDNAGFMVERSADGAVFEAVEEVPGDGSDSYQTKTYRVYDENPLPGISYYRLKQMDYDGTVTYSPVRSVSMDAPASSGLQIFPNPARERVTLLSASELTDAELRLYNSNGRKVALPYSIQDFQLDLQVGALPAGVYYLKITRDGETLTRRLVIE